MSTTELTLHNLLGRFFEIPSFQRDYSWEQKHQVRLFEDFVDHFDEFSENEDTTDDDHYFLGQIISFVEQGSDVHQVIDGQQRLTTLVLLIGALRDTIGSECEELDNCLQSQNRDASGAVGLRHRIRTRYIGGDKFMKALVAGDAGRFNAANSTSCVRKLQTGYKAYVNLLRRHFGKDTDRIRRFADHVLHRVNVSILTKTSLSAALRIFESVNNRSQPLTAADLTKKFLFSSVNSMDESARLEALWREFNSCFDGTPKKQIGFLRDVILSRTTAVDLREKAVVDEIYKRNVRLKLGRNSCEVAETLCRAAREKRAIELYANVDGSYLPALEDLALHRSDKILMSCLLAGRSLDPGDFARLVVLLDDILTVHSILRSTNQRRKDEIGRVRRALVEMLEYGSTFSSVEGTTRLQFQDHKADLIASFRSLNFAVQSHSDIIRMILSRIYAHSEARARQGSVAHKKDFVCLDIEHIMPRRCEPSSYNMSTSEHVAHVDRIGNLALMQRTANSAASNRAFTEKQVYYKQEPALLTSLLGYRANDALPSNQWVNRIAQAGLSGSWSADRIDAREQLYLSLLLESLDIH